MDSATIRQRFLDFFGENGHRVLPSSSLIPQDDPTLLFTNAGMNQFKDLFLGRERRDYARAATCQKCMRVSGKHNDFENVGRTPRHHTFFEMLGNFSFGDYFKSDAIPFAWELFTRVYGVPGEKLWVTVFREDDEAFALWRDVVGVPEGRIVRLDEADNFWAMGETGPCGPCSEIHADAGSGTGCGRRECGPGCDCGRFVEIWNLVFMQFEKKPDGTMEPLPRPCVDTGAGLERFATLLQGVRSNYDTDLFRPLLGRIAAVTGRAYGRDEEDDISMRILADHVRATTFLVADGVLPSNEGRGYVLRKILRRALRHGARLGMEEPFFHRIVPEVVRGMGDAYPELRQAEDSIRATVLREEQTFASTLRLGAVRWEEIAHALAAKGEAVLPGPEAFRLKDTFGVPEDILREWAEERRLAIDWDGFARAMAAQREKSRAGSAFGSERDVHAEAALREVPVTEFTGYEELLRRAEETMRLLALLDEEGRPVPQIAAGGRGIAVFDRTPFYAESGGQVGDRGRLESSDGASARVRETSYVGPPGHRHFLHHVEVQGGALRTGMTMRGEIDSDDRRRTMGNHTATHLLHRALKVVLGAQVRQAGSVVGPARLRFDFNWGAPLTAEQVGAIEEWVNRKVLADLPVQKTPYSAEEAQSLGAEMLFGEKYGSIVRVVSVEGEEGEDWASREFCGGTHCDRTGQIGLFKIVSEKGIASGVRRIEAVTGPGASELLAEDEGLLDGVARALGAGRGEIVPRIEALQEEVRKLRRELERVRREAAAGEGAEARIATVGGQQVDVRRVPELDVQGLRDLADQIRARGAADILVLGSSRDGKAALCVALSERAASAGLDAVALVRRLAAVVGGGGGGRKDTAWAGGKDGSRIAEALDQVVPAVESALGLQRGGA